MSRVLSTVLFLCLPLTGCLIDGIDGNGKREHETRELERFVAIESAASLDVEVVQGDTHSAEVSIDSNLIDRVDTRVSGERLVIDLDGPVGDILRGPHVVVTLPVLRNATLSGSGSVVVSTFEQDEPLHLALTGSGEMVFTGSAPEVRADISGSGDIALAGTAEHVQINVSGSGTVDAAELTAETGKIELRGSGDVRATVHSSARVILEGSGDIDLFGQPAVELSKSGSGDVHVRP